MPMYNVLTKPTGGEYEPLKKFATYEKAYYYVANILWRSSPNMSWSCSLKYLTDGYKKQRIFKFKTTFIRRNGKCYKIEKL